MMLGRGVVVSDQVLGVQHVELLLIAKIKHLLFRLRRIISLWTRDEILGESWI